MPVHGRKENKMSVLKLTKENFETEAVKSDKPVFIDFYADWCGPCKMVSPIVDEIAEERDDIKVCKVNVDDSPEIAAMFGVQSIPSLVIMKDGGVAAATVGAMPKAELAAFIDKAIG